MLQEIEQILDGSMKLMLLGTKEKWNVITTKKYLMEAFLDSNIVLPKQDM